MRLILASASPRRRELLAHLTPDFEVQVSGVDEALLPGARPDAQARRLARNKAVEVVANNPDACVLAADTIVVHAGDTLGKPADANEARTMLKRLRGRTHRVITGVVLFEPHRSRPRVEHLVSHVRMRNYTDADIEDTISRGVPFDKAGGYGIQDPVLSPVEACAGCFCNVMGLPLWTVAALLRRAGIRVDESHLPERCLTCPARPDSSPPPGP